MDPGAARAPRRRPRLPRTRGDGPRPPAGRAPSRAASPHTRGWTRRAGSVRSTVAGFPAHAGMDPIIAPIGIAPLGLPRTRGDGPWTGCPSCAPCWASPHTRGWTGGERVSAGGIIGFPAHAGMDPAPAAALAPRPRLPRTRGDGPWRRTAASRSRAASPHTRGWTSASGSVRAVESGFPAHAGMDPQTPARRSAQ